MGLPQSLLRRMLEAAVLDLRRQSIPPLIELREEVEDLRYAPQQSVVPSRAGREHQVHLVRLVFQDRRRP